MATTPIKSFFNTFISLLILLFHLGCFTFTTTTTHDPKKRKVTPFSPPSNSSLPSSSSSSDTTNPHLKPYKSLPSSWVFITKIFSFKNPIKKNINQNQITKTPSRSSHPPPPPSHLPDTEHITPVRKRRNPSSSSISDPDYKSFPLRNDIFPCPICGEIFKKPQIVEQHQSIKHAITELKDDEDSGKNIVKIIFKTGWNFNYKNLSNPIIINRILKIHNNPKILSRFEEYRELVKSKESRRNNQSRRDERCIADGNELLRFHSSTFICNLGYNGNSNICTHQYCNLCGIIRSGFSSKIDGISTVSNSFKAHVSFPDELEEEFSFMNIKRVILICRVIAGRIGTEFNIIEKGGEETGFDSVIRCGNGIGGPNTNLDEEELLVFNPWAVLPCFAIIYSV